MGTQWNVWYFRQVVTDFEAGIYKQEKNLLNGGKNMPGILVFGQYKMGANKMYNNDELHL